MSNANPNQDFSNKLNEDKDIHAERALAESSKEDEDESSEVEEAEKYFNNRWERPGQRLVGSIETINMALTSTPFRKGAGKGRPLQRNFFGRGGCRGARSRLRSVKLFMGSISEYRPMMKK